ncbi:alpha/beta hydrolase [Haladaptatus sp. DJG-WS-42]|uniref:alpha/beta fold hydrolase n=1 Tax=Haladaptatus sp. DJG-WS-42 TaxID=3120516 RepID=UPI0030CF781A
MTARRPSSRGPRAESASVAGLADQFVEVNGIRTRFYEYGEGEPIVLLHGGSWDPHFSANDWSLNIEPLAERFHVIAPDRIASGMTDNPATPAAYTYQTELDHILAFIDHLGLDEYHLIGSSRGGGLAGRIAVETPDRVKTIISANSATLSPRGPGDVNFRRHRLKRGLPTDETSPTFHEDTFRYIAEMYSYNTDHITDEYVNAAAYMMRQPKAAARHAVMEQLSTDPDLFALHGFADTWMHSVSEHMAETHRRINEGVYQFPTLIVWGRNDLTVRMSAGIRLFDMLSATGSPVRFHLMSHCGHFPYREHPTEFNSVVTAFIDYWSDRDAS